jgi:hypothetical protein
MLRYRRSGRRIDPRGDSRGVVVMDQQGERLAGGQLPDSLYHCLATVLGLAEERRKLPFGEGR